MGSYSQPEWVDATFYAVVVPLWGTYGTDESGRKILDGALVERITKNRPDVVRGGGVATRLTLRIDAAALLPLAPQAIIHINPGQVEVIEATATAPPTDEEQ